MLLWLLVVPDLDSSDDEDDAETSEAKPSAKSEPAPAKGKKGILKNFKEDLKVISHFGFCRVKRKLILSAEKS